MKVRISKVTTVLLSVLLFAGSAQGAFAFPKKLPKLKRAKVSTAKTVVTKIPAVPSMRSVAPAVERAVTARVAAQTTLRAARRTPDEVLAQVKTFITQTGRFPLQYNGDKTEDSLRQAFNNACKKAENMNDQTSRELLALKGQWVKQYAKDRPVQEVLVQVQEFIKENGYFPSKYAKDEIERSLRLAFDNASTRAEAQGLAEDTKRELLALKEQWIKKIADERTPQEVLTQVKEFIEKNGRFPARGAKDETESSLRVAFDNVNRKTAVLDDDTRRELLTLKEQWVRKYQK